MGFKNHLFGVLGSFSWAGAAVKKLIEAGINLKWELVGSPVEQKYSLKADNYKACVDLGKEMAIKLKNYSN